MSTPNTSLASRPTRTDDFDLLPPVAGTLSRGEWLAIGAVGFFLSNSSLDAATLALIGTDVPYWLAALGAATRTALWIAAAPIVFAAFDRLPVRAGQRVRSITLRLVLAVVANYAHGIVCLLVAAAVGPAFAEIPAPYAVDFPPWLLPQALSSFDGVLELLAAHMILQRTHRSRNRQRRAAELETSLARAQLHALSKELEPHFLFNTLNGVVALVRDEPAVAESMLVKLSDMLRLTLDAGSSGELTLDEELQRLALYIDLQQMRFGPRLTVRMDVADDTRDALVPGMLLQPLVENALTHGIGPLPGPGLIEISAAQRGGRLRLQVRDTGCGLSADAVRRESIGLGNTRARLAALYGGDFTFELGAPPAGRGTLVQIEIPRRLAASA